MRVAGVIFLILMLAPAMAAQKLLDIYFVDVEGGQATLIVTPSKQSILVDAGWPGYEGRDAKRIVAAAKAAGVKKIDYLVVTHYHTDHVGGVPQLVAAMPVAAFVDHGPNNETSKGANALFAAYEKAVAQGKRIKVSPGDTLPVKGVEVDIVAADGSVIPKPRQGAGAANPLCAGEQQKQPDPTENARSIGMVAAYGKFRFANLGDITWNKELELVCPDNKVGEVDVYLTTHHGMNLSGPAAIVHALNPRVAVMNNGARKGGSPDAWQIIRKSPRLEDLWQLHYAVAGGKDNNSPDPFIANLEERCEAGYRIKLSAKPDGTFTVTNARNKYTKTYAAK